MWKIGPEWAAQQAKFASARLQNTGVFNACPMVMPTGAAPVVDAASGLARIKVIFDNQGGEIRPGLAARLTTE